ncbi:terminase large subunit [Ralstonia phage RS-PI-1]|uniref:Terminase large subunit n=1 Tax=Ralstonia phage RS-PI-1 TaxID=1958965 RepID=A0A1S6L1C6_9CAUD|nr:terminase large subunit [Ralstonia phage RS-PI-1]AQT27782.1 terminase large subunit [Ralstonia phage RS-PI-1]
MSSVDGPRRVQTEDLTAIWAAGYAHVEKLKALSKAWAKHVSASDILNAISKGDVNAFVYGNHLVVFDIGGSWTSPGVKFFEELLTLRIYCDRGSSYRQTVWCIEALARANGCVGVLLGTAGAYDDRLGRVIERLGYEKAGGSYYKEV